MTSLGRTEILLYDGTATKLAEGRARVEATDVLADGDRIVIIWLRPHHSVHDADRTDVRN